MGSLSKIVVFFLQSLFKEQQEVLVLCGCRCAPRCLFHAAVASILSMAGGTDRQVSSPRLDSCSMAPGSRSATWSGLLLPCV